MAHVREGYSEAVCDGDDDGEVNVWYECGAHQI